jgi:hypothetical protein
MRQAYDVDHLRFVDDLFPNEAMRGPVRSLLQKGYGLCDAKPRSARLVREGFFGERSVTVRLLDGNQIQLSRR